MYLHDETTTEYGDTFTRGDRVALAPHLDLWMMGARHGTVIGTDADGVIHVRIDMLLKTYLLRADEVSHA